MSYLSRRWIWLVLLGVICLTAPGCALLQLPFQVLGTVFNIIKAAPKPPPWVFF